MAADITCIICPNGCLLHVDDDLNVSGNKCIRGVAYGKQEVSDPRRTLTTTVRVNSKLLSVCPVKSADALPKGLVLKCMEIVNEIRLEVPVRRGDVVVKDILGTGIDIIATRDILE